MQFAHSELNNEVITDTAYQLAQQVSEGTPSVDNEATRHAVLRCLVDALGSAAAALDLDGVRAARLAATRLFGAGSVPIWFTGELASPAAALFANSTAMAALDLDDGHRMARGHPGAAVVPAALSVLSEPGTLPEGPSPSAADLISAIAVGCEIALRGAIARPSYAPSGAWSGYGVVATLGRLRKATTAQIAQALAIVAQTAPALPALAGLAGSDVKEGIPFGCAAGIAAMESAIAGMTGPTRVFDDPALFDAAVLAGVEGNAPLIEGVYFKPFGCCRHIHAALDALLALRREHDFAAEDIASVTVDTYRATFNLSNLAAPASLVEAQYSVPFCLAAAAVHGADGLLPLREPMLRDERVLEVAGRIVVRHDLSIEPLFPRRSPARVNVVLSNGARLASPLTDPRGDPGRPLSWDDLVDKFRRVSAHTLHEQQQEAVLAALASLEAGDIEPLRRVLFSRGKVATLSR
jgi:2-methylcitrate dehydratase PrpD